MFSKFLKVTRMNDEGYVIEDSRGAFDFIMEMDAKGWLDRAEFNRGRNFFLKGVERLEKFQAYCSKRGYGLVLATYTIYTTYTYDDHCAHCYTLSNTPLNMKKAWTRAQLTKMMAEHKDKFYGSPDGYYDACDSIRKFSAALHDKTELEYDPMGVWFGRMSN